MGFEYTLPGDPRGPDEFAKIGGAPPRHSWVDRCTHCYEPVLRVSDLAEGLGESKSDRFYTLESDGSGPHWHYHGSPAKCRC